MNPIYRKLIESSLAWRGSDIRSKDDIAFDLSASQVAALEEILGRVQKTPFLDIRAEDCRHPALDRDFSKILDDILSGRGLCLIRGIPVANHSVEDVERIYWAIGTHIGTPLSQSILGLLMTGVQEEMRPGGVQSTSGAKSRADLAMHTDATDIFTLLCVRQAQSGGNTAFTSTLAIHNDLLEHRPEVLPILYRGFPHHRRGNQRDGEPAVTPYNVPVFGNCDGTISSVFVIGGIMAGLHALGRKPTEEELEAIDAFQEAAVRLQFELHFEPGEMALANNLTLIHGRSEFVDWEAPEKKRLLLRLFLQPLRHRRPVLPEQNWLKNEGGRWGIDKIPGREVAPNDYYALPDEIQEIIKAAQMKRVEKRA